MKYLTTLFVNYLYLKFKNQKKILKKDTVWLKKKENEKRKKEEKGREGDFWELQALVNPTVSCFPS